MAIRISDRRFIRERAHSRCEYCRMCEAWEPYFIYHTEHIMARQHGGSDALENLAFACNHCNALKGPNLTSVDPDTDKVTALFHARADVWDTHFRIEDGQIRGLTAIGRTTVFLLQMNTPQRIELRMENADEERR